MKHKKCIYVDMVWINGPSSVDVQCRWCGGGDQPGITGTFIVCHSEGQLVYMYIEVATLFSLVM